MAVFSRPPMLSGTPEQQCDELRRYLFRLTEELELEFDAQAPAADNNDTTEGG